LPSVMQCFGHESMHRPHPLQYSGKTNGLGLLFMSASQVDGLLHYWHAMPLDEMFSIPTRYRRR